MKNSFNKKKINFLSFNKIFKYLIIFFVFLFLFFIIFNELKNKKRLSFFIEEFSKKFDYQFKVYETNNLYNVNKLEIKKIFNKYLDQSIFLIPLDEISDSLHSLTWVESLNLSTNLKNKIYVEIIEYKPIGLFSYNNQIFYFSDKGKIIDKYKKNNKDNFIVFFGNQVLKNANNFLIVLDRIKHQELNKISKAYFINERRWNIKLTNDILIFLSEKNIETSLRNYIKLIGKLKDSEIDSINSIDLRNNEKAIISLK